MKDYGNYQSTAKANMTISEVPCSFIGVNVYASAACTITVVDGSDIIVGPIAMSALQNITIMPCRPISCSTGLSSTNSGGGYYTVFYGNK